MLDASPHRIPIDNCSSQAALLRYQNRKSTKSVYAQDVKRTQVKKRTVTSRSTRKVAKRKVKNVL